MKEDKKKVGTEQEEAIDLEKQAAKKEKINRFFDEFKACLILVAIICSVIAVSSIWYMEIKNKDKDDKGQVKVNDEMGYKYVSYETNDDNYLKVLDNKYVLLCDDTSVLKIMDLDLNVLYENEEVFTGYFVTEDGNLYFYNEDDENDGKAINLYRFEDKELKLVKELYEDSTYFKPIYKETDKGEYIIGYDGVFFGYDENNNELKKDYIYLLNGKEYELTNMILDSNWTSLSTTDPLYLYDDENVLYQDIDGKYGVFNIINNTKVVEANYDFLYAIKGTDNLVAIKDNKTGVIDTKLKKKVDYIYDFIAVKDDFYVVGNNNKLAIMDSSYKLVTGFDFDYQDVNSTGYLYSECCGNFNTFEAYKFNDKYLLITNVLESDAFTPYEKHEAYLIDSNGKYEVINEHDMDVNTQNKIVWAYNKDNKQYTMYDFDLKELYKIDLHDYDFDEEPVMEMAYDTIYVSFNGSNLYYDLKTGKSLSEINNYEENVLDDVILKYEGKDNNVKVLLKDKEIYNYKYVATEDDKYNKLYNKVDDNKIIYYNEHIYFMIKKGE